MNTTFIKNLFFLVFIFQVLFVCQIITLAQDNSVNICGAGIVNNYIPRYPVGTNDVLRALTIFVRYEDDEFECCDGWPVTRWQVPEWYDKVLTPENQTITDHPSIPGYFDAMSGINNNHGWQLRGEEYPTLYITEHPTYYYNNNQLYIGGVVQEMLTNLDQNIDFSLYDKYDPDDLDQDNDLREPDGYVDMLIVWFRWINSAGVEGRGYYSGVAGLGGNRCFCFPSGVFTTNDIINALGQET
jgi:hypothetical protein